ncbi:MAG TPA: signal recognition particle-docking protein FtsY [Burkholderiaceae bacterium]|nr:signal recognition particle-docking protein FtsY [Burkholderiaceae bacterium]
MFSFFKRKKPGSGDAGAAPDTAPERQSDDLDTPEPQDGKSGSAVEHAADSADATGLAPAQQVAEASGDEAVDEAAAADLAPTAPEEVEPPPAAPVQRAPSFDHDQPVRGDVEPSGAEAYPHIDEPGVPAAPSPEPTGEKTSWLKRLKAGLSRTGQSIGGLFVGVKVDESLFEELETALIMADAGMEATEKLLTALRARVRKERLADASQVKTALREILTEHLAPLEKTFPLGQTRPLVVMIAGVNGAGKTTSIGKLANVFQKQGAKVLLAAGDTFRAAAREQLVEWGTRNNVTVIAQEGGDPAAVAFDAVNAGRAREAGVVMIDTAGRLPTQLHLMEELKKIKRVIGKADGAAPHEVLLVIDGNTGQNAIAQIRAFDAAIQLTGLVVTKLDGTAKGGTLAAVAAGSQGVRPVPVYWIGVGEGMNDLQPFVAREFAAALLGD